MFLNLLLLLVLFLYLPLTQYRQSHKSFFGKSDLLFICMLKPRTFHIEKQNLEIEAAQVLSNAVIPQMLLYFSQTWIRDLRIKLD